MTGYGEHCSRCLKDHPLEEWRCSSCSRLFRCSTQLVIVETIGGNFIRAHLITYIRPDDISDPCGPVARVLTKADTALERATGSRLTVIG